MSLKRAVIVVAATLGLVGSPAVRAEVPNAPTLWQGKIVAAGGQALKGEIVAYARPAGLGLDEGSAPLREIARTRTDGSGRYVLRSLHNDILRSAEDQNGWTNVMVAAFGDDGSFNLAAYPPELSVLVRAISWRGAEPSSRPKPAGRA